MGGNVVCRAAVDLFSDPMVKITGEYTGGLHCRAVHGPSGAVVETDAPVDNQGKGEAFSPTDLVATALATCIATTMAIFASRRDVDLQGLRYEVTKEMSADAPRRIVKLATTIWVPFPADRLPEGYLEKVASACPVHQSLSPAIEKPITFHYAG